MNSSQSKVVAKENFDENEMPSTMVHQKEMGLPPEKTGSKPMNKLTAESARQELTRLKEWENDGVLTLEEERYMQALEIALPILEQQERGDGEWKEWGGGAMPVSDKSWVDIKWIDGYFSYNTFAAIWDWEHRPGADNIIAYRIIPERAINQNGEQ